MLSTFLCPSEQEWLYLNSNRIEIFIEDRYKKGLLLLQKRKYREAIHFLGSAFEATEILLEINESLSFRFLNKLKQISSGLKKCLTYFGYKDTANECIQKYQKWLLAAEIS